MARGSGHGARWRHVRRVVMERDGWRCRKCGRRGAMEAHHTVPLHRDGSDRNRYDPAGIVTLCRGCHVRKHGTARKPGPGRAAWDAMVRELLD